jgi:RNA polymerase sigma factor (sigma-70 family)
MESRLPKRHKAHTRCMEVSGRFAMPAAAGNHRVRFDEIVQPHMKAAYALACYLTGDRDDSQDIVQEACLRAYRALDRFRGGSPRAWMLTIVRRTACDWMRRRRHLPEPVGEFDAFEHRADFQEQETPETLLQQEQCSALIRQAVHALPDAFRESLLLRYDDELTHREIALCIGIPAGTVMSRLCRARRQLAVALDQC